MTAASSLDVAPIRAAILAWYRLGHRDLPWRGTRDPYAVLVSEVMLQQTQASRAAVRYPRFMARFPTVRALASAPEADVLAEWSGLGYNRRALSLHQAATAVAAAGWPTDLEGLRQLPGVGAYTARAIGSLAFGWPVGPVDTNVRRWLVRRFDLQADGAAGASDLQRLADALASLAGGKPDEAATWTHASMELGAVVCGAGQPICSACPVAGGCPARDAAERVPVPRQSPFRGSGRAYRGALLRALASAGDHSISRGEAPRALADVAPRGALGDTVDPPLIGRAIEDLAREGLVHLDGDRLRLGPATGREGPVSRRLQSRR
jgi:A/G-specific adenine glycosylase